MSWKPPKFLQELEVIRVIRCVPFLGGKLRLTVASATNCIDYLEQFYLPSTKQHFPAISSLGILFRRKVRGFHHLDLQLLTIFQLKSCPMYLGWWKTAYVTNLQCQWEIWEYRFQTKKSLWFGVLGCWLGPISMARCSHLWTLTPSGTFPVSVVPSTCAVWAHDGSRTARRTSMSWLDGNGGPWNLLNLVQ